MKGKEKVNLHYFANVGVVLQFERSVKQIRMYGWVGYPFEIRIRPDSVLSGKIRNRRILPCRYRILEPTFSPPHFI